MKKLLLYLGMFTVLIIIGFYGEIRKQVTGRSSHNDILYETYYGMIEYTFESTGVTHLVFQKANSDRSFCNELNEGYLLGLKTTCPDCVIKSESCSTSLPSAYQDIFSDKPMALPFLSAPNKRIVVLGIPVQQAISLCHEMAEAWRMGMNQDANCITKTDSSASEIVDPAAKTKTEAAPVDWRNYVDWQKKALAFKDAEDREGAIAHAKDWTEFMPDNSTAWYELGVAYANLGRFNEAIDAYRKAISIDPEYARAWYNLGITYGELSRHNEAIDAYRKAISIDPEDADTWYNLGYDYRELGRHNEAIDAFRQAIRIDPEDAKAWYNLGADYYLSGNRTAALEVVQTLRQLDPVLADKLFNAIVPQ